MATSNVTTYGTQATDVTFNRIPFEVQERWRLVRDVVSGDQALRQGEYLPMLNKLDTSAENVARNQSYRARAVWYPATQFTLAGMLGLAFRIDPQTDLPTQLEYLERDCDGAGVSIFQQSQSSTSNVLQIGRHGLYVDWSAELKHPVIKMYVAERVINWRHTNVNGQMKLRMVVFKEDVEIDDGQWGVKTVEQWREVFIGDDGLVRCRLWRRPDGAGAATSITQPPIQVKQLDAAGNEVDELVLRSRGKPLDEIPFTFVGSENNDAGIDEAPMYGLAQINLAHFRNSADYEDSVFFTGQVQPWMSGLTVEWRDFLMNPYTTDAEGNRVYTGNRMYVGSRVPILLPENGAFGFAQAQPNMLAHEAMTHKEELMISVGARLIEATPGPQRTATGEENEREATTSILSMCVSNVNEAYQQAIRWCARYMDVTLPNDGMDTYKINQDFVKAAANPAMMGQLVSAWQSGVMALKDVRDFFRRLGVIATERDDEILDAEIAAEGPRLGMMGEDDEDAPGARRTPPRPGQRPGSPSARR